MPYSTLSPQAFLDYLKTVAKGAPTAAREAVRGASAGVIDPLAAAAEAVAPIDGGASMWGAGHSFRQAFNQNLQHTRQLAAQETQAHPVAAPIGNLAGAIVSPLNKVAPVIRGAGAARNAWQLAKGASLYGLLHGASANADKPLTEMATQAGKEAVESGVAAPVVGGVLHGAGALIGKTKGAAAPVLDDLGNYTQSFRDAVRTAFPNGEIQAEHIDPAVAAAVAKRSGTSPAAINQMIAEQHGVLPTAGMVSGSEAPTAVKNNPAIAAAAGKAKQQVAANVAALTGGEAPNPSALAEGVGDAYIRAKTAVNKAYDDLAKEPLVLGPSFAQGLRGEVDKGLKDSKFLPGVDSAADTIPRSDMPEFNNLMLGTKQGGRHIPSLPDKLSALGDRATLTNVDGIRQQVNAALDGPLKNADRAGLLVIKNALDNQIEKTINAGDIVGDGEAALAKLQTARDANSYLQTNFVDPATAHKAVRNTVNALRIAPDQTGALVVNAPASEVEAAGQKLGNALIGSKDLKVTPESQTLYDTLNDVAPGSGADDYIRRSVGRVHYNEFGEPISMAAHPSQITTFLTGPGSANGPYAGMFSPAEEATLRTGAAVHNMASGKTAVGEDAARTLNADSTANVIKRYAARAPGIAAGAAAGAMLPGGHLIEPLVGGVLANKAEGTLEALGANRALSRELAGAPPTPSVNPGWERYAPGLTGSQIGALNAPEAPTPEQAPKVLSEDQLDSALAQPTSQPSPEHGSGATINEDQLDSLFADKHKDEHADGGRVGFKSGGAVKDIDHLVNRLMQKAKHAKKASDKATEPLLGAHDNAIASALAVAQKAI